MRLRWLASERGHVGTTTASIAAIAAGIAASLGIGLDSKALEIEARAQQDEIGRLRLIESRFRELESENANLRHALNFAKATKFEVVTARITRRQPTTWWQTVEIDRGENAKIGTQLPVLCNEGLVGQIDQTRPDRATVILLTDEKCQVSAKVEGTPEVGIVSGLPRVHLPHP